ncbi:MAG: VOC family protein [Gemmatimonadaceae bacterium]
MIDHIIYAAPDLDLAVAECSRRYGITPSPGGRHIGFGTRNALVGLGEDRYLEIVALDPEQDVPVQRRFLALETNSTPKFAAWCARASRPLEETVAIAREAGYDLGEILPMSRSNPDGTALSWRWTSPFADHAGGVLPFYIDWGDTPSPASSLLPALTFLSLTVVHPDADRIRAVLDALSEREVHVERGPGPSLDVVLR